MPDNEILPRLLTVPEVAELLHINAGKVHELRKSGLLPFLKLGAYKCRPDALAMMLQKWEGGIFQTPTIPGKWTKVPERSVTAWRRRNGRPSR